MNKYKNLIMYGLLLLFLPSSYLWGREATEMWKRLYQRSTSMEQKLSVMQHLVEQDDPGLVPTLIEALSELVIGSKNLRTPTEKENWTQLCRLIVRALGNYKATESSQLLFQTYEAAENPVLKSEALTAIGKVRGTELTERITLILRDLNLRPQGDAVAQEIIAYGCINALEKLRGNPAYKQVFLASQGWYSKRVKDRALSALPLMSDDPTDVLAELIKETSPEVKLLALQMGLTSSAPSEKKVSLAVLALEQGLYEQTTDIRTRAQLGSLRTNAINALIRLESKAQQSIEPLKQAIELNYDINERLNAVLALGINGSDAATRVLATLLDQQNQRQMAGTQEADNRFTIALIRALGMTRNPLARPVLQAVEFSNYTPAMVRISKEALQQIEQK
ncbi:MAG: hypothetical protein SNJ78_04960 [Spirochaetales bacterium]